MISVKRTLCFFSLFLFPIYLFTEETSDILALRSGDLTTYMNTKTGHFSLMDLSQQDPNAMSVLFGGTTTASSYAVVFVDGESKTFNQLESVYPFGQGLGAIDGVFLAGLKHDIKIEVSFFVMDIKGDSSFDTIGLAFSISNYSLFQSHKVAIKLMLDTDVGEHQGDPLIYLPSGAKVSQSLLLRSESVPPYFFLGHRNKATEPAQGNGYYLYPLLSSNLPSLVLIGNWLRLSDAKPIQAPQNSDFNFDSRASKDAGFALYFGDYHLSAGETQYFGIAISKHFVTMCPLLDENILAEGVFSPIRFETQEILDDPKMRNKSEIAELLDASGDPYFQEKSSRNLARQQYRWKVLGWTHDQNKNQNSSKNTYIDIGKDDVWDSLGNLDSKLKQLDQSLDQHLVSPSSEKKFNFSR